jgi:hypothetical protein
MRTEYPVAVEVTAPGHFERIQLLLRIALAVALAWIGVTAGWLASALYAALPVVAAIAISSRGSAHFKEEVAPPLWRVLRWLLAFSGYMALLVDRFPTDDDAGVRIAVRVEGTPTEGSALARLLLSLPSALVLAVLACIATVLWVVAAVLVLVGRAMPPWIAAYQRGVLRWTAHLVAYHASLVDTYPPFAFDTGDGHGGAVPAMHAA